MLESPERLSRWSDLAARSHSVLRYRAAAPIVRSAPVWADLGCGTGTAAADALAGLEAADAPGRTVLVDRDAAAVELAVRELGRLAPAPLATDLESEPGIAAVRAAVDGCDGGAVTCFGLLERLSRFAPVVQLLLDLAARGFTVVLAVPNKAFWGGAPASGSTWGEGSAEELRRLLPDGHVSLRQVPLAGSALVAPEAPGEAALGAVPVDPAATPVGEVVAFGPRAAELHPVAAVAAEDLTARRRWEAARDSELEWLRGQLGESR